MRFWVGYAIAGAVLAAALTAILLAATPDGPWWTGVVAVGAAWVLAIPAVWSLRHRWRQVMEPDDHEHSFEDEVREHIERDGR